MGVSPCLACNSASGSSRTRAEGASVAPTATEKRSAKAVFPTGNYEWERPKPTADDPILGRFFWWMAKVDGFAGLTFSGPGKNIGALLSSSSPPFVVKPESDLVKPEEDLIREALDGSSESFSQLVERFQSRLFSSMVQIVGSYDEAEDVVQDSFVQAYLKLDSFQGNSKFFTWLYRIAFNNALSRQRRKRPELSVDQNRELTGSDPEDRVEAPDEPLLREERVSLVHRGLQMLTDEHRHILVLREMDEMSYEDIADLLSINIGTVRSRLSRARTQLRIHLEELQSEN